MKKALGLDIGDVWTGIAISDPMKIVARPLETIKTGDLENYLKKLLEVENIDLIVVGYPVTMKGRESEQTKKTTEKKNHLEKIFVDIRWILWDERLSSKRAHELSKTKKAVRSPEEKLRLHSLAAAFILDSYLT